MPSGARLAFGRSGFRAKVCESHRRSTWNLGRPVAQGPEGAAGPWPHRAHNSELPGRDSVGSASSLSPRVRCALTPWPARAGMLDREGSLRSPDLPVPDCLDYETVTAFK